MKCLMVRSISQLSSKRRTRGKEIRKSYQRVGARRRRRGRPLAGLLNKLHEWIIHALDFVSIYEPNDQRDSESVNIDDL